MAAFRQRGDEIVAHGHSNAVRQSALDEAGERELIRETTDAIAKHEGKAPAGWLGPWIAENRVPPDLLNEAGYAYLLETGAMMISRRGCARVAGRLCQCPIRKS